MYICVCICIDTCICVSVYTHFIRILYIFHRDVCLYIYMSSCPEKSSNLTALTFLLLGRAEQWLSPLDDKLSVTTLP